ncbi:MAG TPA: type II toxin-antitoxin system HipA family toxin [Verrucomicrobiae bacterium]|jgi:serine/threonine-protein kinase HipA|nr:type II toxin-antitoxin system HipA family toxin [Verrucomicrobiae bacterium]
MPRKRQYVPLRVLLNNVPVGQLQKEPGGAISFHYDERWLSRENPIPVSLSLPLREDAYRGLAVSAVFDNLLPDSEALRQRVAEQVGADGTDAYSLLSQIGRECVGALQFVPEGIANNKPASEIDGRSVSEKEIEALLINLARAPLGLDREQDFRISVAGAQEKTALLRYEGKWLKPFGTTPTTHILKTQIGTLPNGMDLSNSVENEYYCLKFLGAFGLPVNSAEITTFGKTKALVIERFDRRWVGTDRILRLPQEDFCQALSCPPTRKYQGEGGPVMVDILEFLKAADAPAEDQKLFLKAQILFWLIAATDGHAKNFSVFLGPQGRFRLTPLYDVLSAQPSLNARQIECKQMKLAMSVGRSRHYRIEEIHGHHFVQTAEAAGLPGARATDAIREIMEAAPGAMKAIEKGLPQGFPKKIHTSITAALANRLKRIEI